jgi:hypothetical protein
MSDFIAFTSLLLLFGASAFFLMINLSRTASSGGKRTKMITVAQKVPSEIDLQILPAIAEAKLPTIAVTITRIEAEVKIAPIDLL